jgi:SpoVK/Ycf46/Vps4 family AAA+-type ATPase
MSAYLGVTSVNTTLPTGANVFTRALFKHKFEPYQVSSKLRDLGHLSDSDYLYQTDQSSVQILGPNMDDNDQSGVKFDLKTQFFLPIQHFTTYNYQIGSPILAVITQTNYPHAFNRVTLLGTANIHLSKLLYRNEQHKQTSLLDYSNFKTPQTLPLTDSGQSNACLVSNGFILPPDLCTCTELFNFNEISIKKDHKTNSGSNFSSNTNTNTHTQWNKCLYCYMNSSVLHDLDFLYQNIIFPILFSTIPPLNPSTTTSPIPPTQILTSPIPTYSHAIRIKVQVIINTDGIFRAAFPEQIDVKQLIMTLQLLSNDKLAIRELILNSPLKQYGLIPLKLRNKLRNENNVNSEQNMQNNISNSRDTFTPILFLRILETYPSGIVIPTITTNIELDNNPNHSNSEKNSEKTTPSSPSSKHSSNISQSPLQYIPKKDRAVATRITTPVSLYQRFATKMMLFPVPTTLQTETLSIQTIFKLLWINLNKYFYSAVFSIANNPQHYPQLPKEENDSTSAFQNLQMTNIKGILLHGPPGVGKTFAAVKAIELFPQALAETLRNVSQNSTTPPTLLNLPLVQSVLSFQSPNTIQYPVIRLCSIDSSSVGEYTSGVSESRVDNVFFHAKQRQLKAEIPSNVLKQFYEQVDIGGENGEEVEPKNEEKFQKLWSRGFQIQNNTGQTSQYVSNDKIYPLFSSNHLNTILNINNGDEEEKKATNIDKSSKDDSNPSQIVTFEAYVVMTVLLIDEIDSICTARDYTGESQNLNSSLTNHFLTLLDGLHDKPSTGQQNASQNTTNSHENPQKNNSSPSSVISNRPQFSLASPLPEYTNTMPYESIIIPHRPITSDFPTPLFIIGTTNNPNNVDIAIKRSGRLDQLLTVQPPNAEQRYELLQQLCRGLNLSTEVDLEAISESCIGYVAADLANLVRTAQTRRLTQFVMQNSKGLYHEQGIDNTTNIKIDPDMVQLGLKDFIYAIQNTGASSLRSNAYYMLKSTLVNKSTPHSPPHNPSTSSSQLFQISQRETLQRSLIGNFASSIGGLYEAKLRLLEAVVWPIKYKQQCAQLNLTPPHGILLHGPPGNGKTTLARAVSFSLNATFIPLDMATVYNSYLGESERLLREVFSKARDNAPAVIFIDELDSIVSKRNMGDGGNNASNDVQGRILSTLLNEMDGIPTTTVLATGKAGKGDNNGKKGTTASVNNQTILVFAATNRIDMLDAALLRPGRFDYILPIENCTEQTSFEILTAFCAGKIDPKIDLFLLNQRLYRILNESGLGANGSNITNAVYQTASIAVKRYIHGRELLRPKCENNQTRNEIRDNARDYDENNDHMAHSGTKSSSSIWNINNDGNTLGTVHRYEIEEYFSAKEIEEFHQQNREQDSQSTKSPRPVINMGDFDAYLKPLEDLIERKRKQ